MIDLPDLSQFEGFDWDRANARKNWEKHRVSFAECEEIFFHGPVIFPDPEHSQAEPRYFALGITARGRKLTAVFTLRKDKIRVVSARDMSRKERSIYAQEVKKDPEI